MPEPSLEQLNWNLSVVKSRNQNLEKKKKKKLSRKLPCAGRTEKRGVMTFRSLSDACGRMCGVNLGQFCGYIPRHSVPKTCSLKQNQRKQFRPWCWWKLLVCFSKLGDVLYNLWYQSGVIEKLSNRGINKSPFVF